jgi:hypothetical protein
MPKSGRITLRDITDRIKLDDKDFDNLAHPIGKKLSKVQRSKILEELNFYDKMRRWDEATENTVQDRKAMEKVAKTLEATIAALRTLQHQSPLHALLFWRTGIKPDEEMGRLASLHAEAVGLREAAGTRGRKKDDYIGTLLFALEKEFVDAGGGKTGVTRVAGIRKSNFIDFAWEILAHVPKDITRPYDKTAQHSGLSPGADEPRLQMRK